MKVIIAMLTLLVSFGSMAGTWHSDKINRIYPLANGNFILTFVTHPEACTNNSKYFYVQVGANAMSQEGAEKIYSLALTAATTGQSVRVYFDEAADLCYINRAYVNFQ